MSEIVSIRNPDAWAVQDISTHEGPARRARRQGTAVSAPIVPKELLLPGVHLRAALEVVPSPARRGAPAPRIDVDVKAAPGERSLIVLRHPSAAMTFHTPSLRVAPSTGRRSTARRSTGGVDRYSIDASTSLGVARRGIATKIFKMAVLKI
ncbi:MAG TPA: hypothetical protein VFP10_15515, partial [Candidatus Eisenbacteria bacterium]|nr:hypothetical protein [Candidatus Eisenbacteria bacterium]